MLWLGLVLLVAGAVVTFGFDLTVAGAVTLAAGAVLLIAGIVRRARRRRRNRSRDRSAAAYGPYRTRTGKIAAMVAAAVYIVSPIDLIPDVFLPVGIVDDATALTWLVFAVGQELTRRSRAARGPG